jgi:hypothetical protein
LILIAWLDVFTHEPAQNPTVTPNVYEQNLAREDLKMNPQPELGGSRAMVSSFAANEFVHFASGDPKQNFLAKRAGYCANVNLLDDVPKVDGFFSLTPRENNDVLGYFYRTTNADFPRLEDFTGVSQITAPGKMLKWESRATFLPLVTAGQKPVFLDDEKTLSAMTQTNFDGSKIVFLPPEAKSFVTVSNQTSAKILNSKFSNQTVDIEVEAQEPSLVVVAQTYYHDWRAFVDGQPTKLLRANDAFQAVQIEQGKHHIHFFYKDRAFEIGAMISIFAWLGCLAGLSFPAKKLIKNFFKLLLDKNNFCFQIVAANGEHKTHRHFDGGRRQSRTERGDPRRRQNRARFLRHGDCRFSRRLSRHRRRSSPEIGQGRACGNSHRRRDNSRHEPR